ncbi:hypothetical protein [Kitasatospora sp. NPDC087314]|uniref:hypothetical protein n=1 Tax=Kitasatospora sp. NPDC087314 TaxID=3364068 RepID=UPI0037F81F2F
MRAVLTLQTLAPPAALGMRRPPVVGVHLSSAATGVGVVTGCFIGATRKAVGWRKQALADHPAGYLPSLEHDFGPADAVARIRSAISARTGRESGSMGRSSITESDGTDTHATQR